MSRALKKHIFSKDYWIKKSLKITNVLPLTKFCCSYTLRQGTILIAVVEVLLTSLCLFLMLLSAIHAKDIVAQVHFDLQQLEENNLHKGKIEESLTDFINNEKKLQSGQQFACIVEFVIWSGVVVLTVHFASCILLLYGALQQSPKFLLPWTSSSAILSLVTSCFFIVILIFIPLPECKYEAFAALILLYGLQIYCWFVVFSYYQELKT